MFDELRKSDPDYFTFDWTDLLVSEWKSGERVALNEVRRPRVPTGYYLRCATAGQTAAREPSYPQSGTVNDGSVVWTVLAPAAVSVPTIASATYTLTPAGITIDDENVFASENKTQVKLNASAAEVGEYSLLAEIVDSAGEDHSVRVTIDVVEQRPVKINVRADVVRARAFYRELRYREINYAAANALNVVMRTTRNETLRKVQAVRQVRPSIVRAAIKIVKRASFASLSTMLEAVGRPISLKEYSARQGVAGVTVNVMGQTKILLEAFGPGQTNRRRWPWRGQVLGGHVFARLTPARLPIKYLFGPSIPTGFVRQETRDAQQRVMERDWPTVFKAKIEDHLVKLRSKYGGKGRATI